MSSVKDQAVQHAETGSRHVHGFARENQRHVVSPNRPVAQQYTQFDVYCRNEHAEKILINRLHLVPATRRSVVLTIGMAATIICLIEF
jgi:hypothetical protein